jgi:hypothetical protein
MLNNGENTLYKEEGKEASSVCLQLSYTTSRWTEIAALNF